MRRVFLSLIALVNASCVGPTAVTGPYANRLSPDDIRQISAFVERGWAPGQPSVRISAIRPDHVIVDTRLEYVSSGIYENFAVTKRRGQWTKDNQEGRVIVH
jgi:hypothetical protein